MKKTLALVLALVMVIGMMAVPASADFTDAAEVKYTEAVDVVAACGIIEGYNNEFNPQGELTRAAGAKLVAYLELGAKRAEALTAEKAPFEDVPADHWAAGYIGWAVGKGYIAGNGDGTFAPDAPLSAVAYAKLLLCALGYDAAVEGYTGAGYEYNIIEDAIDEKLFDGNDDIDYAAVCTREEAALYTFNALNTIPVKYDGGTGTKIEINGAVIATGAGKLVDDGAETMAEKLYTKLEETGAGSDAFYRPATEWTYDGEDVGTYAETPEVTYTAAVKGGDIYTALGKPAAATTVYDIYVNGHDLEDEFSDTYIKNYVDDSKDSDDFAIASGDKDTLGKNGTVIEIYERDLTDTEKTNGKKEAYVIVVIDTFVGEIKDWTEADLDDNGDVLTKEKVEINALLSGAPEGEINTTAFDKDDEKNGTIVLYTYSYKSTAGVKSVVAAEYVEDVTVSGAKANSTVTADGTTYKYSNKAPVKNTAFDMKDSTYTLYTDAYGYVILVDTYEEGASKDYVMILDIGSTKAAGDFSSDKYQSIKYIDMAGNVATAKVMCDKVVDDKGTADPADDVTTYAIYDNADSPAKVVKNTWYTLAEDKDNDGYMVVKVLEDATDASASGIEKLSNDKPAIAGNVKANAKTIFVLKTDDDPATYKTYTGIKNLPGYTFDSAVSCDAVLNEDGYAVVVYIDVHTGDSASSKADDVIYLLESSSSDEYYDAAADDSYFVYKAIVDGEKTTVKSANNNLGVAGLIVVDAYDANGWVEDVTAIVNSDSDYDVVKLKNREIKFSDPTLVISGVGNYVVADDCVVYMIDADDALTVGDADDLVGTTTNVATNVITIQFADDVAKDATVVAIWYDGALVD